MPNHIHGILVITARTTHTGKGKGKAFERYNTPNIFRSNALPIQLGSQAGSVPAIVQNYKSITSRKINKQLNTPGSTIWHRNYYEHIIRDEEDYNRILQYIQENPLRWEKQG